jgi:hypothetical protein
MPPWLRVVVYVANILYPAEDRVWIGLVSGILISVRIAISMFWWARSMHACSSLVWRASWMFWVAILMVDGVYVRRLARSVCFVGAVSELGGVVSVAEDVVELSVFRVLLGCLGFSSSAE